MANDLLEKIQVTEEAISEEALSYKRRIKNQKRSSTLKSKRIRQTLQFYESVNAD